ncbi:MAG: hypothetical protein M0Z79_03605 [Nitrospiraceae bacterium]|nr:hypothetical protein [Nitrospiraceae bacterium]
MEVPYDEIYISTMREMDVCRDRIRKCEQVIAEMERARGITTEEFLRLHAAGGMTGDTDYVRWYECSEGLRNWKERLQGFEEILKKRE